LPQHLAYAGSLNLTDKIDGLDMDAGKMVLSATRTYAPVMQEIFKNHRSVIHGLVHCSGGGQTKVLHFVKSALKIVKNNLFETPVLFKTIQKESKTDWREMYQVFNMGHRMEIYLEERYAEEIIDIAEGLGVEAQIIGRVLPHEGKKVTVQGAHGTFEY
jgi:phosphoribosylformylglycinamidine cyclo-ligase